MDSFSRPTWVEVSLDALEHNIEQFRQAIPDGMKVMAVLKADAYGHGAVKIAQHAESFGVDYFAVAFLDEAIELRNANITSPILVLGYTPPECVELASRYDISLTVYTTDVLDACCRLPVERPLRVHVKLDTGMGRLGIHKREDAISYIKYALGIPQIQVEALYTHFACADETDKSYTYEQHQKFSQIVDYFESRGVQFPLNHTGNSATAIEFPELSYQMIRLGVSMYGLYPSAEVNREKIKLRPMLSLKTKVVMVKTVEPDSGISYGATYRTKGYETIATLPIGYADGFTRMLSGRVFALCHGRKVPVVGRICMDQCMINVTELNGVKIGDEVVLIGQQQDQTILADDLAETLDTINYEIVCMMSHRIPRVYVEAGRKTDVINHLIHQRYVEH